MKPRKLIRSMSKARTTQNHLYTKLKAKFLRENEWCFKCMRKIPPKERTLHHFFGRTGQLLIWVPGFRMADCFCHQWIEQHRNDAVKLNLRAPNDLFNRPSLVIPR